MKDVLLAAGEITNPALGGNIRNLGGAQFFGRLVPSLVGLTFLVGAIVFFFILLIASIQWISSGGDKGSLEAARSKLTNALVGVIVLFASYAIISLIETFFGIDILALDIGPLKI